MAAVGRLDFQQSNYGSSRKARYKMGLSLEEQETVINFSRVDNRAVIYTSDTRIMTKLNKLVEKSGTEWKLESVSKAGNKIIGMTYSCPVEFISFRSKHTRRKYTEEQKRILSERLRNAR